MTIATQVMTTMAAVGDIGESPIRLGARVLLPGDVDGVEPVEQLLVARRSVAEEVDLGGALGGCEDVHVVAGPLRLDRAGGLALGHPVGSPYLPVLCARPTV